MFISAHQLSRIYRHADWGDVNELAPWIGRTLDAYEIDTPLRAAHFLAQVGHESGELRYREELASGRAYEGRKDLGNTEPGDGARFKGRGLIQLTGRANYARYDAARELHGALLSDPARVADDNGLCCDVAGWYWHTRGLNAYADQDSIQQITRRINGGLSGLRDRQRLLTIAKVELLPPYETRATVDLQRSLNRLGYGLSVDGVLGARTIGAVLRFQKEHGLHTDGIPGPNTWAALKRELGNG